MSNLKIEPLVSIITPVYNISDYLFKTIESVIHQTYKNWELILVDDCSVDSSPEIMRFYSSLDGRVRPFFLEENQGAGYARNFGLEQAKGEYVAFLDSDDVWLANKLQDQVEFMRSNISIEFSHTWYSEIDENDQEIRMFVTPKKISFGLLKYNNYILTSSVLCTRDLALGSKFSLMRRRQDWVYFLELLKNTKHAYAIDKCLVHYRKSSNSLSSNRWKLIKPNFVFFKSYLFKGNFLRAIIHFLIFLPFYFHNKIFNNRPIK